MKKDTFYFSHDYATTNDPKIQALLAKFGARGYGIYWRLVEILHEQSEHKIELKPYFYEALSGTFREDSKVINEIITYCVEVCELFVQEEGFIYSKRVLNNIAKRDKIKEARSQAGKKSGQVRANKSEQSLTSVEQNLTNSNKVKESKVKEIKEIINYDELLNYFNKCFTKSGRVFNDQNKNKFRLRIKDGYTLEQIKKAMFVASRDQFHVDNNFKYCTLEYFTRPATIDKYAFTSDKKAVYIPTK